MQLSKKNNNRKRKERPLTSYFTPVATVPVVARAPAVAATAAAIVAKHQEKSDGIGEKRISSVGVDVESTTPINNVIQQQSTKQAQASLKASTSKKMSASNPKSKNKKQVSASDDDDDDDDIALSDLKQPKVKNPTAKKGRMQIAASKKEKKHQQEPVVAVRVPTATSKVPVDTAKLKRESSSISDNTDRCSTSNTSGEGNENAVEALQDRTNASNTGAEEEVEAARREEKNGHTQDTSENKLSLAAGSHNASRSRSLPPSTNVVHQLFSRSVHGAGRKKIGSVSAPPPTWKIPSWIDLCPGNSAARNSGIKSLAWDEMGVLLAAYCDDRCIRIYDWDMVVAANVKGRNLRTRQAAYNKKDTECLMIEPILVFPFPFGHVSLLKWNPFNPDELAVANSLTGDVYLYDINQVCARQEERTGQGTPYRKLAASEAGAVSELVFLQKGKRLVLCQNDLLYCWSIGVGTSMTLLLWKFRWKAISSIVPLGRDVLVLGSKQGHLAMLNWKKMQRAAFSLEPMPTLLNEWISYKGLEVPSSYAMGIQHLRLENSNISTDGDHWGHCRLVWGTACGWVLSTTVTSATTRMGRSRIHYSTKPIRCVKIKGEAADEVDDNKGPIYQTVEEAKRSWSYNGGVVVADSTKSALCWEKVPEVIKILPRHHDKRVLEHTGPRYVAGSDTKPTIMWMRTFGSNSNGVVYSVPLSKRKGPATAIAIHPSNEWIIVGTATNGIYAINGRSHIRNAKESL